MLSKRQLNYSGREKVKNKKAQEEMVGFSLIIIIVAIIILVLFSVSLRSKGNIQESYETDNFMQAFLQYTTECSVSYSSNYLDVRRLIRKYSSNLQRHNQRIILQQVPR